MQPGDRLICAFVAGRPLGLQFRRWLLHVTVVPWFRLPDTTDTLAAGLQRALQTIAPFQAAVGDVVLLGPHKTRSAHLLQEPTPFTNVEQKVRAYLHKKHAWLVDETTKRRREFRPHVTVQDRHTSAQGDQVLRAGDIFLVQRLYIVEQKGDYKEIVSEIRFE